MLRVFNDIKNKLRPALLIVVMLGWFSTSFAQGYSIRGKVVDKADLPIPGATILLINESDTNKTQGMISNLDGSFHLQKIKPSKYMLRISYVGFNTIEREIRISNSDVNIGSIVLEQSSKLLGEVQVEASQVRVEIKGDTVQYNAGAFKTHIDATAEDLLKKMPGVTSESNTLKVNGEEVKKVLVDGKPFFGDDPNATVKNLPAYIVDNVQVFDQQSDQALFTGFRDGNEEKAINLTTKKGMNVGDFGNIYFGYGTDGKYSGGFTLNHFNGKRKVSVLGMSNNINQQNFNISDIMSVMSNSGGQQGGRGPMGGGGAGNFFTGQQGGITKTNAIGINYIDSWGKKIEVSGSYFFNQTHNTNTSDIVRNYFTENNLQYIENSESQSDNMNHRFNFKLEYSLNKNNKITLTPRLVVQENNTTSLFSGTNILPLASAPLNATQSNTFSESKGYNFSNDLLWQHKFNKNGRTVSLNLNQQINNRQGLGNYFASTIYNDLLSESDTTDQKYNSDSRTVTYGANLSYSEPIGSKAQILLSYKPAITSSNAFKETLNPDALGEYTLTDTYLSNTYKSDYISQRGGINYMLNTNKSNFSIGADVEQAELIGQQSFPDAYQTKKSFFNILPSARYTYNFDKTLNLNLNYRSSTNVPSISQLQNSIDVSNPLFVKVGNPNLKQSYEHSISFRTGRRPAEKDSHFMVFLRAGLTKDYISNATYIMDTDTVVQNVAISSGSQLTKPVNLDNYYNVRIMSMYGFPVSVIKSNLNFMAGYNYSHTPALINGALNYASNNGINGGMFLSSNINENIDFTIGYNGSYNTVANTLQKQSNTSYYNHNANVRANFTFFQNRLVLNTDLTQSYYAGLSESYNQTFTLWNAYMGYKFFKDRSLELKLSVYDILDQNKSISRTVTEAYTQDSNTKILNRYALFTLTYTFKKFKNGAIGPEEIKRPGNMPPPPGNMLPPPGGGMM